MFKINNRDQTVSCLTTSSIHTSSYRTTLPQVDAQGRLRTRPLTSTSKATARWIDRRLRLRAILGDRSWPLKEGAHLSSPLPSSCFFFSLLRPSSASWARTSRHCHLRRQYGFNDCISFSCSLQFQNNYPFSSSPFLPSVRLFPYFFRKFSDSRGMDHSGVGVRGGPAPAREEWPRPPRPPPSANHGPPLIHIFGACFKLRPEVAQVASLVRGYSTWLAAPGNSCICQTAEYRKPNCSKLD